MARSKNPLFSQEASGDLAGIQFRRGTYGQVIGRRSITPALMTPAQCAQRGRLKLAHTAWTALADADRAAWNEFATYPETGRNAYIAAHTVLSKLALAPSDDPRFNIQLGRISNITAQWDLVFPTKILLKWSYDGAPTFRVLIYYYPTWSHRAAPKPSKLKYIASTIPGDLTIKIAPPFQPPITWIRLELRSIYTAKLSGSYLLHIEAP